MSQMIPPGEALPLNALITPTPNGIASRILANKSLHDTPTSPTSGTL